MARSHSGQSASSNCCNLSDDTGRNSSSIGGNADNTNQNMHNPNFASQLLGIAQDKTGERPGAVSHKVMNEIKHNLQLILCRQAEFMEKIHNLNFDNKVRTPGPYVAVPINNKEERYVWDMAPLDNET